MSEKHVKDLLSGYIDDALSNTERARVDAHIMKCDECGRELEALKKVSKAVSGLPKAELPQGFMRRLERRRREDEREALAPKAWLPPPARIAAFAATGAVVCLIFAHQVRYRLAPKVLPSAVSPAMERKLAKLDEMSDKDVRAKRKRLAAKRSWKGMLGDDEADSFAGGAGRGAPAPAKKAAPKPAPEPPAEPAPEVMSMGQPVAEKLKSGKRFSNEELQRMLEQQKREAGIRKIVPPPRESVDPWSEVPQRPLTTQEAKAVMQRLSAKVGAMNRAARARAAPTVPIGRGSTPRLLQGRARSRPLGVAAAPAAIPVSSTELAVSGPPGAGGARTVAGSKSLHILRDQETEARVQRPRKVYKVSRRWTSSKGGMGVDGGAVIRNPADWKDMWSKIRGHEALPAMDFAKEMAIAVFAKRSVSGHLTVTIDSVVEADDLVVVSYRLGAEPGKPGPTAPYDVVIVPSTNLQIVFEQLP